MTLFQLLPGSWPHLMPQGQQGGLFSALDFPDSGGSSCTLGKRTHDLARKWVYRLRESVQVVSVHSFPVGNWDQVSGAEIRQL